MYEKKKFEQPHSALCA